MGLLTIGAIAASAVVIGSVALPVVADRWSEGRDEANDLTAATGSTVRKANDLAHSFSRVVPDRAAAAGEGEIDDRRRTNPETLPASNGHAGYGRDLEHEVAVALEALATADSEQSGIKPDDRIIAIENLRDVWEPRFRQAEEEHRRLAYRIDHADRTASRYFDTQTELTRRIGNIEDRLRAEGTDQAEREIYRRWREQAERTTAQADVIMADLRDMDIRITKQLLSANFASVYHDFQMVPIAIDALHRDLEQFRARSEEISATFGAP